MSYPINKSSGSHFSEALGLRVVSITEACRGTKIFTFADASGCPLPGCEPGASIALTLPDGKLRTYSILDGAQKPDSYRICVKQQVSGSGGSTYLHRMCRVGDILWAHRPVDSFRLFEHAFHSVFIAGGIGISPIYSMVRRLQSRGRSFYLHYAVRSCEEAAFHDELHQWENVSFYVANDKSLKRLSVEETIRETPLGVHLYCCGPASMLSDFRAATEGRPKEEIHFESFAASSEGYSQHGVQVHLARTGVTIDVAPNQSILSAILEKGVNVKYSCCQGTCGSCEVRVLEGIPDHKDFILSDAERAAGKTMFICCSGAIGDELVLDI